MIKKTENKENKLSTIFPFDIQIKRYPGGLRVVILGVVGIGEFSENAVLIKCHGIKVRIAGSNMRISVLENKCIEIDGKVEEIKYLYAKA